MKTHLVHEIRHGTYADSIVLMQLQSALAAQPEVADAGVVMATEANLDLLRANGLLPGSVHGVQPDDLLIVVKAASDEAGTEALARVDQLMERQASGEEQEFRPKSIRSAWRLLPEARWVLVSVPGRYAAQVGREALEADRHVFLYSDNVALGEETSLKAEARKRGRLVMGPDCGTAIVGGVGLGFANRVRRGPIGIVAAAGTGLQTVADRIHSLGSGISHGLGTGGRDLSAEVGGATALQALDLLARDGETRVLVIISKPPAPAVAARVVGAARACGKPVVVSFSGLTPPVERVGNLQFARGLDDAARRAVELAEEGASPESGEQIEGFLRGLFSGGTLALEILHGVQVFLDPLHSNLVVSGVEPVADPGRSEAHTLLDLGADEFTVGRPHPMIDQDLRIRRLKQEAADPEVGMVLLDVVLGEGSHADPAGELAPAVSEALARDDLEVVALVVGTDEDPQDLEKQVGALEEAGAKVFRTTEETIAHVATRLHSAVADTPVPVASDALEGPFAAINVGLETFYASLVDQEARAVQVEWRPPARGNEKLAAILDKMRG
jgi:FdrA protein